MTNVRFSTTLCLISLSHQFSTETTCLQWTAQQKTRTAIWWSWNLSQLLHLRTETTRQCLPHWKEDRRATWSQEERLGWTTWTSSHASLKQRFMTTCRFRTCHQVSKLPCCKGTDRTIRWSSLSQVMVGTEEEKRVRTSLERVSEIRLCRARNFSVSYPFILHQEAQLELTDYQYI